MRAIAPERCVAEREHPPPSQPASSGVAPADPLIGQILAEKYVVLERIAKGGMGRIYRAEQRPLGRIVALKVLDNRKADGRDPEFRARFLLEAATLGRLRHPNTVTVYDYGVYDPLHLVYIVMEYVEGRTLTRLLKEEGPLPPARALRLAYEVTRALGEAHEAGVVHRDLKPGNVMIGRGAEGEFVKVLDFGIAKVLEEHEEKLHITRADQLVGSPRYMAPEQIHNEGISPATDHYALGVILFELMTGLSPFARPTQLATLFAHLQDPAPSLSQHAAQPIPPSIEALVNRLLAKSPRDRFPDTSSLRQEMLQILDALGERPTAVSTGPIRPMPIPEEAEPDSQHTIARAEVMATPEERRGRGPMLALIVLLGLALGAGGAWVLLAPSPPEPVVTEPEVAPEPPPAPTEVTFSIESTPPGAEVWEGEVKHGVTPLSLPLSADPDAPGRAFTLRLEGYKEASYTRGPSAVDVTWVAPLEPRPVPKRAPTPPANPPEDPGFRTRR
ncbi:MAG: serine/threonine protein kinase [Alphaproteobacteria bacterium]|nr:serine/threonine protein kinase [Alphaproteobacteria bacterium]